jgi:photosystem II stability/assembly factor-like uncharacterized protein
MKKLLLFLSVVAATQVSAQYVSEGPRGGSAHRFYSDAGRVWLAAGGGLFYSNDDGVSWKVTETPPIPASCEDLLCVAAFGNEIYVGANFAGIMHSNDGGRTWSVPGSGVQRGFPYVDVEIAGSNAVAIRGDNGTLLLTTDHGSSWTPMNFTIGNAAARSLAMHNNAVYVTSSMGLFKSIDNGLTYNNINPSTSDGGELTWSHDTMYVASSSGLKMSTDDGMSFSPLGLAGTPLKHVSAYGKNIYASIQNATQDTLKMSSDGGMNFSTVLNSPYPYAFVYDLGFSNGRALVGTDQGIFAGSSLQKSDSGFHATVINALAVNGIRLYAATSPMGVFYTTDSAEHWQNIGGRSQGVPGDILSIDARNQYVHAGGLSGYFRSSNFGTSWSAGATGLPSGLVNSILAVKGISDVIAVQSGNLYLSSNDGTSFTAMSTSVPTSAYLVTQADTLLFVATTAGLYKSNSSYNFAPVTGLSGLVSAVVSYKNHFYASTHSNGLFISSDGMSWTAVNPAPGVLPQQINALAVKDTVLFVGTDDGLYSDSTGMWHADSLQGQVIHSLAVSSGKLYAGTCSGVWSIKNIYIPPGTAVPGLQQRNASFTAYPNPAKSELFVSFESKQTAAGVISMTDLAGRKIWQKSVNVQAGKNVWHLNSEIGNIPNGIYFLQLNAGNITAQQKIVLEGR